MDGQTNLPIHFEYGQLLITAGSQRYQGHLQQHLQ